MNLLQLFRGCFFSHDRVQERDEKGRLIYRCQDCGDVYVVLPKQKLRLRKVKKARVLKMARKTA